MASNNNTYPERETFYMVEAETAYLGIQRYGQYATEEQAKQVVSKIKEALADPIGQTHYPECPRFFEIVEIHGWKTPTGQS